MKRSASAMWNGDLKTGKGTISTDSGVLSNTQYSFSNATGFRATTNFGTPRQFYSGSPSFSLNNSSYNREFQLGIRFDF